MFELFIVRYTHKMKTLLLVPILLVFFVSQAKCADILVTIQKFRNDKGQVLIALHDKPSALPSLAPVINWTNERDRFELEPHESSNKPDNCPQSPATVSLNSQ